MFFNMQSCELSPEHQHALCLFHVYDIPPFDPWIHNTTHQQLDINAIFDPLIR